MPRQRLWIAMLAALGCLAYGPSAARGSVMKEYRLQNNTGQAISVLDFNVVPPGAVVPPSSTDPKTGQTVEGSPISVLSSSTGFDVSKLSVALGGGNGVQGLRLLFGQTQSTGADGQVSIHQDEDADGNPVGMFNAGATLDFALSVDPKDADTVQLIPPPGLPADGLVLTPYPFDTSTGTPTTGGSGSGTDPVWVPEPWSLTLWSALTALGLARARVYRRRRARLAVGV